MAVPIFSRYWRPGSISSSAIHSRCAANWSETSGRALRARQHIAARDIDFVGQGQRDGIAGHALRRRSPSMVTMRVTVLVRPDLATATASPGLIAAAGDGAGEAAEIQIGPVDPLHRHAERLVGQRGIDIDGFQMRQQRRARVPGRLVALVDDIVAEAGRDRDRRPGWRSPAAARKLVKSATMSSNTVLRVIRPGRSCSPPARCGGCPAARRYRRGGGSGSARPCAHRSG